MKYRIVGRWRGQTGCLDFHSGPIENKEEAEAKLADATRRRASGEWLPVEFERIEEVSDAMLALEQLVQDAA